MRSSAGHRWRFDTGSADESIGNDRDNPVLRVAKNCRVTSSQERRAKPTVAVKEDDVYIVGSGFDGFPRSEGRPRGEVGINNHVPAVLFGMPEQKPCWMMHFLPPR
jgi:hypothetical protein